jgi:hypothetical protein
LKDREKRKKQREKEKRKKIPGSDAIKLQSL